MMAWPTPQGTTLEEALRDLRAGMRGSVPDASRPQRRDAALQQLERVRLAAAELADDTWPAAGATLPVLRKALAARWADSAELFPDW